MSKIHSENKPKLKTNNIMMRLYLSNIEDNKNMKGIWKMRQFRNNTGDSKNIKDKDNLEMIFSKDMIQIVISLECLFRSLMLLLSISQNRQLIYGMFISLILLH